ncbi:MAG TPA: hypothetical protein VNM37_29550, partial [Candidatus Dormibacteraeota bacterium]|nr:hypothetical protein [Candidatus Dormibacteraeota bacterium]
MNEPTTGKLSYRCAVCWETIAVGTCYTEAPRGKVHYPTCPPKAPQQRFRVEYQTGGEWRKLPSEPSTMQKAVTDAQRLLTRPAPVDQVRVTRY